MAGVRTGATRGIDGTPAADPPASSDVATRPSRLLTGSTSQYFGCALFLKLRSRDKRPDEPFPGSQHPRGSEPPI